MAARAEVALQVDGDALSLHGELGLATVEQVLGAGREAIARAGGTRAVLDLTGVTKCDSAGLALVVDWVRTARERRLELDIRGVPGQLADIARVSGLEGLIKGGEGGDAA